MSEQFEECGVSGVSGWQNRHSRGRGATGEMRRILPLASGRLRLHRFAAPAQSWVKLLVGWITGLGASTTSDRQNAVLGGKNAAKPNRAR
jgi:hypothetical protein